MQIEDPPMQPHPRPWWGILGVVIALSAPLVQALLIPWFEHTFGFPTNRFVSLWVFWMAMILVLGITHFVEGYPLSAFGFQRSQKTLQTRLIEWILAVLAASVAGSAIILFSGYVRDLITDELAPLLSLVRMLPVWVLIPAWITGSFTEEVLFQSYLIGRLTQLMGQRWLATLITRVLGRFRRAGYTPFGLKKVSRRMVLCQQL